MPMPRIEFGKVTETKSFDSGKITKVKHAVEQSIAVIDKNELFNLLMDSLPLIDAGKTACMNLKIIADPKTNKLKRVVRTYEVSEDAGHERS